MWLAVDRRRKPSPERYPFAFAGGVEASGRGAWRTLAAMAFGALASLCAGVAQAQVTNGDFSAGATGWTSAAPSNSSLTYTGGRLTAVSDDNGGTDSRTIASQSITVAETGYLSALLVSWTTTDRDLGPYDYPTYRQGTTYYWLTTAGGITTSAAAGIDNDNTGLTNLTVVVPLAAGTYTIGFGVTATDSQFGPGTAIWDDVQFQQLTQTPGGQTTNEDVPLAFTGGNAIRVASNSNVATMTVTLGITNGTLTLSTLSGITITSGANGSAAMTFTGTPAAINTALTGLTYTPTANFFGSSTLTFTATAGATSDTDTVAITVNSVPDYALSVSKTTTVGNVTNAGTSIPWTITITNTGDTAQTGVTVSDQLTQTGASAIPITLTGPTGDTGTAGTLSVGETWTYTASRAVTQAQIDNGANLVNQVTFGTTQMGASAATATATTTIATAPQLSIVKSYLLIKAPGNANATAAQTGDTIRYSYVVTNTGNLTFTNVEVADVHEGLGSWIDPVHISLTDNGALSDSPDGNASATIWGTLAPGDSLLFRSDYVVTQADFDTQS